MGQVTVTRRGICEIHIEPMTATLLQSFRAAVAPRRDGDDPIDLLLQRLESIKNLRNGNFAYIIPEPAFKE
jgi:hypothetical protein